MVPVAGRVLQRVDGHDDPPIKAERVPRGGQLLPDPLDPLGVQPHQRDGEPRPQLVLELLQHRPRGHYQDPLAPATLDQFGQHDADLQRLPEPDRIGDQHPGAQVTQRDLGRRRW